MRSCEGADTSVTASGRRPRIALCTAPTAVGTNPITNELTNYAIPQ